MNRQRLSAIGSILCAAALALLTCFGGAAARAEDQREVRVMTENMDAGTDFGYLFAMPDLVQAATFTYGEILQSAIPARAAILAQKIARERPDLISLQEVTLWEASPDGLHFGTLYDQLQLLLNSLAGLGQHYQVVVSQKLTQNQLPVDPSLIGRPDDPVRV